MKRKRRPLLPGVITEVAKYQKGWTGGLPETPCGLGSKISETVIQREWIPQMIGKYDIRTIADIGAGDMNWIDLVVWPHPVHYRAFDLVPRRPAVQPFDIIQQVPDSVDCIMCLWVLNHLPEDHARQALENVLASGSKYLMLTWWPAMADFMDLEPIESVMIRKRIGAEIRLIRC